MSKLGDIQHVGSNLLSPENFDLRT
ncbi:hypothetical protein BSP101_0073 [Salmonella phage BSP101]|uniref:Uncharacterized protein n=1 Tax=Salmonella phage BSP101 TaxID=1958914 RepID=A0A2P0QGM8_9CAUD|nr:hypothetical protein HYP09_gp215 [Salmonella phage BSP101]ARM69910.1 hypothetical protein BSP101_0073 [Salmonella phage BSP101]